jgi:hypothetical protein
MARRETILDLLDRLAPDVQAAFVASIAAVTSDTQLAALEAAIRRGDVESALRVLRLGSEYFAPLDRALRQAYEAGGDWAVSQLVGMAKRQGVRITHRFDARNPRAEMFLRDRSSRLIVEIADATRDSVRATLRAAAEAGTAPRTTALDIVGRINKATGRREGGLVGLTTQQDAWARNALGELTSGDPAQMRAYLGRAARDRRFDRTVASAIREGRPVDAEAARKIVGRYRDGLLRYRGETIARTELLGSLGHAENEGLEQMIDAGTVRREDIKLEWDASEDRDTRESHRAMDGQTVTQGEAFVSPVTGARMRFPGDRSLGAPAAEVINCRCRTVVRADFVAGLRDRLSPDDLAEARRLMA